MMLAVWHCVRLPDATVTQGVAAAGRHVFVCTSADVRRLVHGVAVRCVLVHFFYFFFGLVCCFSLSVGLKKNKDASVEFTDVCTENNPKLSF